MKRKLIAAAILILAAAGPALAFVQPPPSTGAQSEYVPVTSLPVTEQLPAAPMVVGAYAFIWVVLLVYVFFIWRRMKHIEHELADLQKRIQSR